LSQFADLSCLLFQLGTDILFGHPSFKAALNYYKKVPLYFYLYDITPRITLLTMFGNCTHLRGKEGPIFRQEKVRL
jgi:hypothetical protein